MNMLLMFSPVHENLENNLWPLAKTVGVGKPRRLQPGRSYNWREPMAFVKKNPWIVIVGVFAILIVVGIATS